MNPPEEPAPNKWGFPPASEADENGVVALGADLEPGTILSAYRQGLFPMPVDRGRLLGWWSPDPRGVLPLDGLRVSKSLRRSCQDYEVRFDTAFDQVMKACSDRRRPGAWISKDIRRAYQRLHAMGWVHSVEAWDHSGALAGGLYGVSIGGLFAGESMFHHGRDASKVALVGLVEHLRSEGATLLDVQWATPHLRTLGVVDLDRERYVDLVSHAVARPQITWPKAG